MRWRTAGVVMGALGLVCLFLVFFAVYPVSLSESNYDERFVVDEDADEYRVTVDQVVDDQPVLGYEGIVTADGERYSVTTERFDQRTETYQPSPDGDVYTRLDVDADVNVDERLEWVEDADDRDVVRVDRGDDVVTIFVIEKSSDDLSQNVLGSARMYSGGLSTTTYERVDERDGYYVYEPEDGWFEGGTGAYRITDSSGTVEVDSQTNSLRSATVSWDRTEMHGPMYLQYLLVRTLGDEPKTWEITYDFEKEDVDVHAPDWVEEIEAER